MMIWPAVVLGLAWVALAVILRRVRPALDPAGRGSGPDHG